MGMGLAGLVGVAWAACVGGAGAGTICELFEQT